MLIKDLHQKIDSHSELDIEDGEGEIVYEGLASMSSLSAIRKNEILNMKINSIELGTGEKHTPALIIYVERD